MPKAKSSSASKVVSKSKSLPQTDSKSQRSKSASNKGAKNATSETVPIKKGSKVIRKEAKKSSTPANSQSSSGSSKQESKKIVSKNKTKNAEKALALLSTKQRDKRQAAKKKVEKEPEVQPAQSAFELFSSKIWQMYKDDDKFQSCSRQEKKEIVKKSWSKLTKEKKQKYEQKAKDDQRRYEKESRAQKKRRVSVSSQSESEQESEEEAPQKIAKKSPKQDNSTGHSGKKVKKVITNYNAFCRLVSPRLREENPDCSFGDLASKVAQEYRSITDEQLAEVSKLVKEDQKRYDREMKEAKNAPPVSKSAKATSQSAEKKGDDKPQTVMPKQVMTTFFAFINQNRERIKKENPDKSVCEIGKLAGQEWKALTDDQKKEYDKVIEEDRKRYKKEMDQLKTKGYFINSDGVKSTDLKVKSKGSPVSARQEGVVHVPKGLTNYKEGTMLPKQIRSPFFFFSAECWETAKNNRKDGELFDYIKVTKDNAEKWKNLTEDQRKKYQELYETDKQRREDQFDQIRKKGYFMTEEGIKSTDLPVKKPKIKAARPTKQGADQEAQD